MMWVFRNLILETYLSLGTYHAKLFFKIETRQLDIFDNATLRFPSVPYPSLSFQKLIKTIIQRENRDFGN